MEQFSKMTISFKFLEIRPIIVQAFYSFTVFHAENDWQRNRNYLNKLEINIEEVENLRAF
jgi:hypothetical protein